MNNYMYSEIIVKQGECKEKNKQCQLRFALQILMAYIAAHLLNVGLYIVDYTHYVQLPSLNEVNSRIF